MELLHDAMPSLHLNACSSHSYFCNCRWLKSTSKGLGLLTKMCVHMCNIIKNTSTCFFLSTCVSLPSHFPASLIILLYSRISYMERTDIWKCRNLAPVAPFSHVEGDHKTQVKYNIVNMEMFHNHIAWVEASVGNYSEPLSSLLHRAHTGHYKSLQTHQDCHIYENPCQICSHIHGSFI